MGNEIGVLRAIIITNNADKRLRLPEMYKILIDIIKSLDHIACSFDDVKKMSDLITDE
ncbi:MAG: hypothetical protein ACYDG2_20185 [Ruminiclostridium sp.]